MSEAFSIGAIAMRAQQQALDTIANNIANVNTQGFKRTQVRYADLVASRIDVDAAADRVPAGLPQASGVVLDSLLMLDRQGDLTRTGRSMDLAIQGGGFIELMGPSGQTLLWRGGGLKIGEDGLLSTDRGIALKAGISVPQDTTAIEIGQDGIVRAQVGGAEAPVEIGQIRLVRLDDAAAVEPLDGGLYRLADELQLDEVQPGEDGAGILVQGALEQSNVELTDEMVRLIMVQRAYAAGAQIVQAADQLMAIANGLRR